MTKKTRFEWHEDRSWHAVEDLTPLITLCNYTWSLEKLLGWVICLAWVWLWWWGFVGNPNTWNVGLTRAVSATGGERWDVCLVPLRWLMGQMSSLGSHACRPGPGMSTRCASRAIKHSSRWSWLTQTGCKKRYSHAGESKRQDGSAKNNSATGARCTKSSKWKGTQIIWGFVAMKSEAHLHSQ